MIARRLALWAMICCIGAPLSARAQDPDTGVAPPESTSADALSPSDSPPANTNNAQPKKTPAKSPPKDAKSEPNDPPKKGMSKRQGLMASLTIFVLAIFVGFEVISKVPPTLHTPLMSGSNAISGITIVGALFLAGLSGAKVAGLLGTVGVVLASINVVGGFLVTHRMLAMFQKK